MEEEEDHIRVDMRQNGDFWTVQGQMLAVPLSKMLESQLWYKTEYGTRTPALDG